MPKRGKNSGKQKVLRPVPRTADIEAVLDDIDAAMLAGNSALLQDLMSRLWAHRRQAPEVLTQRIIEGRAAIPAFAFELIGGFAGPKAISYLKRIAEERGVQDVVRFGAKRRAGWPEGKDEAKLRLDFLSTLDDADQTLVVAAYQSNSSWPPEGDILEEVLGYLEVLPSERRRNLIALVADQLGEEAVLLLQGALHIDDAASQRLALGELAKLREWSAIGAIERLAKTASDPGVRVEASATAQRLRIRPVDLDEQSESETMPALERALMSEIDGDGGQAIIVIRRSDEGAYLFTDIFHNDHWGIKEIFGVSAGKSEQIDSIVEGLHDAGIDLVQVDLPAVRGALVQALEVNAASGHTVPPHFEVWEPLLHDVYPPPPDEPWFVPELDDAPYGGRDDLIKASARLADHDFFDSWPFDPMQTLEAMVGTPDPSKGRLTDRQYRPLIERFVDPPTCIALRGRLRRQAWLLDRLGDADMRDLALAVAAQLAKCQPAELAEQPFLRTLVQRAVDRAVVDSSFFRHPFLRR